MRNTFLVMFTVFFLTACSKVSQENYAKLKTGMSQAEVESILGSADMCTETLGTKTCTWGNESKNIMVNFVGDATLVISNKGL